MPFFFIVPVWLFVVVLGLVLFFLPPYRRVGLYVVIVSTAATLASFVLSTAVLYVGVKIGAQLTSIWLGLAVVGSYVVSIGIGAVLGVTAGFALTRKLLHRLSW